MDKMAQKTTLSLLFCFIGSIIAQNIKHMAIIEMNLLFSETNYQLEKIYMRGAIDEDAFDFRYRLGFEDEETDLTELVC